jgi:cytochrome c biogenesis protein CcmG, thiol:disulfide interchange protein DsbE
MLNGDGQAKALWFRRARARSNGSRTPPHGNPGFRAANGSRTRDLQLGKLALYQLSYRRELQSLRLSTSTLDGVKLRLVPTVAVLAGACIVALLAYGVTAQSASRTLDELVHEGRHPAAPGATRPLQRLGAPGSSTLAAFRGRVVLLNFWASWCEPCEAEAPLLERAQSRLASAGGTVLGVTYEDLSTDAEAFVSRFKLTYPSLRDTSGEFAHSYGTNELPESFIVDRNGDIVAIERGEIGMAFVNRAIAFARST